jgi:hypothetical protein
MCTTSPNAFLETEQEKDFTARSSSEEDSQQPDHQHYHILRTSGKVPAGFLHYLTGIVSKQGYEVVLDPEQDS